MTKFCFVARKYIYTCRVVSLRSCKHDCFFSFKDFIEINYIFHSLFIHLGWLSYDLISWVIIMLKFLLISVYDLWLEEYLMGNISDFIQLDSIRLAEHYRICVGLWIAEKIIFKAELLFIRFVIFSSILFSIVTGRKAYNYSTLCSLSNYNLQAMAIFVLMLVPPLVSSLISITC